MSKPLFLICIMACLLSTMYGCNYERVYYHNRNGHYRSVRAKRSRPWFNYGEKGYNKAGRRAMRHWDRSF